MVKNYTEQFNWLHEPRIQLSLVLALALILRIWCNLAFPVQFNVSGGDYPWFADFGRQLITTGTTPHSVPTSPLFLFVAGFAEILGEALSIAPSGEIGYGLPLIRALHIILGTLTVLMVYRIGRASWTHNTGLIAAFVIALNPIFIIETKVPLTETLAVFLLMTAFALWMERIAEVNWRLMAGIGIILALAALTRAVLLLIPALFILHLCFKTNFKTMLRSGAILLVAFFMTIMPWTIYNLIEWNEFTLAGQGVRAMLYIGAAGWEDPADLDENLGYTVETAENTSREEAYSSGLMRILRDNLPGYIEERASQLGNALLQPHNTPFYRGESLKSLVMHWLQEDRSLSGLMTVLRGENFFPKLIMYIFHSGGMIFGMVGLIANRKRWRDLLPLYLVFGYFLGIHTIMFVTPRYLYPLEGFWWVFGAASLIQMTAMWRNKRNQATKPISS